MVTVDREQASGTDLHALRRRRQAVHEQPFGDVDTFEGVVSDPASLHKYAYAANDPANLIDPSGQFYIQGLGDITIRKVVLGSLNDSARVV